MDENQLITAAGEKLREACHTVIDYATDGAHLNQNSQEMRDAIELLNDRIKLCFTLKQALHEVKR